MEPRFAKFGASFYTSAPISRQAERALRAAKGSLPLRRSPSHLALRGLGNEGERECILIYYLDRAALCFFAREAGVAVVPRFDSEDLEPLVRWADACPPFAPASCLAFLDLGLLAARCGS